MKRTIRALCALVASTMYSSSADAELVDLGDVTRDTLSGLEWRDLSQNSLCSIDEVLASTPHCDVAGWRYATAAEVCDLLTTYAVAPPICPSAATHHVTGSGSESLVQLLDATEGDPAQPLDESWLLASGGIFKGPGAGWGKMELHFSYTFPPGEYGSSALVDESGWTYGTDFVQGAYGHLLVRETAAANHVPSMGPWGIGILWLGLACSGGVLSRSSAG
jgi:hypothetical protein